MQLYICNYGGLETLSAKADKGETARLTLISGARKNGSSIYGRGGRGTSSIDRREIEVRLVTRPKKGSERRETESLAGSRYEVRVARPTKEEGEVL